MNGCNYIRECIDQADKPNLLSFEVTEHLARCTECEEFANERTALRTLLASSARVTAPVNFNAVLNSRLAEVKARPSFWWLGSPGFLRIGAATAGLVIMIFAAQYAGLFSGRSNPTTTPVVQNTIPPDIPPAYPSPSLNISTPVAPPVILANNASGTSKSRRGGVPIIRGLPPGYMAAEDGGVVLVRGQNGDMDVQMPTVSVGAQPLLYVSGGQRPVRTVGTSF